MGVRDDIDIDKPRYDQATYFGRAKHFIVTTNPLNLLASSRSLERSKQIVQAYRRKEKMPDWMNEDDLWRAKQLYDSSFHPDTGEKLVLIGRMSAQMPVNTMMAVGMMTTAARSLALPELWEQYNLSATFYKLEGSPSTGSCARQLFVSYICATTGALVTALGLKHGLRNAPKLIGRFVPFAAVAAANCVNIPGMRWQELKYGTPLYDKSGNRLGMSSRAATEGIIQVIFSRIFMSVPPMGVTPVVINYLEVKGLLQLYPWLNIVTQTAIVAFGYLIATPLCCAFFKQTAEIPVSRLEKSVQHELQNKYGSKLPDIVLYNKGL